MNDILGVIQLALPEIETFPASNHLTHIDRVSQSFVKTALISVEG
jgi:hypothetical protein